MTDETEELRKLREEAEREDVAGGCLACLMATALAAGVVLACLCASGALRSC